MPKQSAETPAMKFKRLAESRVNRAIRDIRAISNLANKANYDYTDSQVKKIVRALRKEVSTLNMRFEQGASSGGGEFRL